MQSLRIGTGFEKDNPLDIIEKIVECNEWVFDRHNDQDMVVQVPGSWCDYSLHFSCNDDIEAIHFSCAFDMRVAKERKILVHELLALVNDKLWLGHFSMWEESGVPMFRHAIPLRGANGLVTEQMEDLVETAINECERFYPAFQYVIWGGKSASEAFSAAMIDTMGEA